MRDEANAPDISQASVYFILVSLKSEQINIEMCLYRPIVPEILTRVFELYLNSSETVVTYRWRML